MNNIIDKIIDQCYKYKAVPSDPRPESLKPTVIPPKSWETVNLDFGGLYPDGHYKLVMVDQRSRYSVMEEVHSTSFKEIGNKHSQPTGLQGKYYQTMDHYSNQKNL